MPGKSAHVKNEKQYEALKDKGMSKERAAKIAELSGRVEARRREVPQGRWKLQAGWNDSTTQGRGSQGRQGDREEELTVSADAAGDRDATAPWRARSRARPEPRKKLPPPAAIRMLRSD